MEQTKGVKMNGGGIAWPGSSGGAGIEPENGTGRRKALPTSMNGNGMWGVVVKPPGPPLHSNNSCCSTSNNSSCYRSEVPLPVEEGGGEGCKKKIQQQAKNYRVMQKGGRLVEVKRNDSESKNEKGGLQLTGVKKVGDVGIKKGGTGSEKDNDGGQSREAIDPFTLAMVASILQCVSHGPKTEPELRNQLILDLERCRSRIPSLADKVDSDGNVAQHVPIQGELLEVRLIIDILQALGLVRSEFVEVSYGGGPEDLHPEPISKAPNCTCRRIMGIASLMLGVQFAPALPTGSRSSNRVSGGRQKPLPGSSASPLSKSGYSKPTVEMSSSLEPCSSFASTRQPFPPPPTHGIRNKNEAEEYVQSLHAIALGKGVFRLLQLVEDRSTAYAAWLAIEPYTVCHGGNNNSKNSNIEEGKEEANKAASSEAVEVGSHQMSSLAQPNNSVTELPIAVKRLAEEGMFDHIHALYGDNACNDAAIYVVSLLDSAPLDSHAFQMIWHGGLCNRGIVKATYGNAILETLVLWVQRRVMEEDGHQRKKTGSGSRGRSVGGGGIFRKAKSVVPQAHQFLHPKIKMVGGNDTTTSTVTATVPGKRVVRFRLDPAQDRVLTDWKAPSAQLAKLDDEAARLALCEELLLRQLLSRVGMHLPAGYSRIHCIDALRSHKPHAYSEGKRSAPAIKRAISMGLNTGVGGGGAGLRGSNRMVGGAPSSSYGGTGGNNMMQHKSVNFPFTLEDIDIPSPVVATPTTTTKKEVAGVKGEETGTMTESVDLNSGRLPTTAALSSLGVPPSPSTVCKDSKEVDATVPIKELPRRTAAQLWVAVRSNPPFPPIQTHKDMWQSGSGGESGLLGAIPSTGKMGGYETGGGLGLFSPATPSHRRRRLSLSNAFVVPGNPDVPPLRCGFQQQYKKSDGFQGRRRAGSASNTPKGLSNLRDWDDDRVSSHPPRDQEIERSKPKWRSASEDAAIRTKPTPWSLVCSMLTDITDEGTPVATPRLTASTFAIGGGHHDDNKDGKKLDKGGGTNERRSSNTSYQQKHSPKAHLFQGAHRTTTPPPSLVIHSPRFCRLQGSELLERVPVGKGEGYEDTSDEVYQKRHSASLGIMKEKFAAIKKARSTASAALRPVKKRSKSGSWFKSKNPPPPA